MRKLLYFFFIILTLSVAASCINRPDIVLDEDQMVVVLVDVHRAEGLLEVQQQQANAMSPKDKDQYDREIIAAVLQKHGVTRAQYDSSLMWYAQNLKLLTRVYGHVDERLKEEHEMWSLQATESRDFGISQAGDSVDLWQQKRHLVLDIKRYSDIRFWKFPTDSNFMAGDILEWQFQVDHLLPGQKLIASISLTPKAEDPDEIRYNDRKGKPKVEQNEEPVGYCNKVIRNSGEYTLQVKPDSLELFGSAIIGLVLIQDTAKSSPVFVDSISLHRYHPHGL